MLLLIVLVLVSATVKAQSQFARREIAQPRSVSEDYRLPSNVIPILYQLELEPNFDMETFSGNVRITVRAQSTANTIVLHMYELYIVRSRISLLNENGIAVNKVTNTVYSNDDKHFYTITFEENLVANEIYILVINSFTGLLNYDNEGFYLGRYINEDGVERKFATTQFEVTSARKAFPCFDEPALKAQFEISITRTADYHSISNMPLVSTVQISSGRFKDTFERSVLMSTYLVAFIVSDFSYVTDGVSQRVFGIPALIGDNRGDYALETGIAVLDAMEELVGVPYTLDKLDQVGLPAAYFSFGGMENWGLIIYSEYYLMYAKGISAAWNKQNIATVIAHEIAHQWFGNLVSPSWWRYIWLNEGFATYFEYYAAAVVEQDMELMDQMVIMIVQQCLALDSTFYSRPMNQDAGSPDDIWSLFDVIAYYKGGAVIRMAEGFLSTRIFRRGLNIYLNKMKFQAAQPTDLYSSWQQALDELSDIPPSYSVASVLGTWDSNTGYPLITVRRDYRDGYVTLTQRRFETQYLYDNDDEIWYVPISYATGTNPDFNNVAPKFWLTTTLARVNLSDLGVNDWLLVNVQQSGYYRVNYDSENWLRIINFLNSGNYDKVHRLNRAQLLDDSLSLARHGEIDYSIPLGLIQYIKRETDFIPLYPFVNHLSFLDTFMSNSEIYEEYKNFILNLLEAAVDAVGFSESESDGHVTSLNRYVILSLACKYGREDCRKFGLDRLRDWQQNEDNRIPPNLQTVLACAGLRNGNQADWDFVLQMYLNEQDAIVRDRLISALGCSENEDILDRFLDIILDSDNQLTSDRQTALASIYSSGNFGRDYLYNYFKDNWTTVSSSLDAQATVVLYGIAGKFSTREQYNDLKSFAEESGADVAAALSAIESNIIWADRYMTTILNWFNENLN